MDRIFYRKSTSILFVTAILVLLILVCMLLALLTTMSSLRSRVEELNDLIQRADGDVEALRQELADRDDIDYVIKWAEAHNMISEKDVQWLKDNL